MKGAELVFAPLGGCREIGMNLNAYGYGPPDNRRWIIVDVGVTFGYTKFGDITITGTGVGGTSTESFGVGSGTNAVVRVGLAVGLGG